MLPIAESQATTISASTAETTIVTANPGFPNMLVGLIISTTNAAAGTLTLRDSTAGTTRAIIDYPNAALAPAEPAVIMFPAPLGQASNNNWTLQASANAAAYHVTALFYPE